MQLGDMDPWEFKVALLHLFSYMKLSLWKLWCVNPNEKNTAWPLGESIDIYTATSKWPFYFFHLMIIFVFFCRWSHVEIASDSNGDEDEEASILGKNDGDQDAVVDFFKKEKDAVLEV
jgi:hypothetical protein